MSYINTLIQPLRAQYPNGFDKNETRMPNVGAWDSFVKNTPLFLTDDVKQKIKMSDPAVPVQVPAIDATPDGSISIRNARSCSTPADDGTSRLISLAFETIVFSVQMNPADFVNNEIGYQAALNRKLEEKIFKVMRILDARAISNLETNKNVFDTIPSSFYTVTGNDIQVPLAGQDDFYNNLSAIFGAMDYDFSNIDVIADWQQYPIVNRYRNQGAGNQTNLQFQFGPYNYYQSSRVVTGSNKSVLYAAVPGNYGVETRVDLTARMGERISESQYWETINLPIIGLEAGVRYDKACADRSNIQASLSSTVVESYEFSFDITYMNSLVSSPSTQYAPILKADFLTS